MRILVTGGCGFVGGSLAPMLRARHDLLLPTSRELNLLDGASVASYLTANPVDVVLHGAVRGSAPRRLFHAGTPLR